MITRMASVDYLTFLMCYKYNLWGANNVYVSKWKIGDHLVFKVGDKIVAIAEIVEEAYMDDTIIWENGLFWNRVPLKFIKVLSEENCVSFEKLLKPLFTERWGKKYGWVILNKHPLPDEIISEITKAFKNNQDESKYYKNIDNIIAEVKSR